MRLLTIATVCALAACGSKGSQSFRDGMTALCSVPADIDEVAPVDRQRVWSEHAASVVNNREARNVFEALSAMNPDDRIRILRQEMERAGLTTCPLADLFARDFPDRPTTVHAAIEPFDDSLPLVTITARELRFRDFSLPLQDGVLSSDQRDGQGSLRVPTLIKALGSVGKRVNLFATAETPYATLIAAMYNITRAGGRTIGLVAARPDETIGVVPLTIPDSHAPEASDPEAPPDERPLGMVVSIFRDDLSLGSTSGIEGTLHEPLHAWKPTGPGPTFDVLALGTAVDEVIARHWGGKRRPDDTHRIGILADDHIPFATVIAVMAVVRVTPAGEPRFSEVLLSQGIH